MSNQLSKEDRKDLLETHKSIHDMMITWDGDPLPEYYDLVDRCVEVTPELITMLDECEAVLGKVLTTMKEMDYNHWEIPDKCIEEIVAVLAKLERK